MIFCASVLLRLKLSIQVNVILGENRRNNTKSQVFIVKGLFADLLWEKIIILRILSCLENPTDTEIISVSLRILERIFYQEEKGSPPV